MNEDFTEEEEFDELPTGVEFAEPTEKKSLPASPPPAQRASAPQQRVGRPRKVVPAPTPAAEEAPVERYVPFKISEKVGILDNETNQTLMEDENVNNLLLGLMTKLLNDVEDIKKNL